MLDAGYDAVNSRFTTLSFIAVNGTPPTDILRSDPYDAGDYSSYLHVYEEYTDRETIAFGFNDTIGGTCQQALANYVFFGIKCVHPRPRPIWLVAVHDFLAIGLIDRIGAVKGLKHLATAIESHHRYGRLSARVKPDPLLANRRT